MVLDEYTLYGFQYGNNITVPSFDSYFLKKSVSYSGAISWNAVLTHFTGQFMDFYRKVKKDIFVKETDFTPVSLVNAQALPRF